MTVTLPTPAPDATVDAAAFAELATALKGTLALPGSPEHAVLATPWNTAVPPHPYPVVAAADVDDVVAAVRFAGAHGLRVEVRATGHCPAPTTAPTLLIHTGRLQEVTIDVASATARVGAGVRWRDLLDAAAAHGLFGLCGSAPHVGVVGYLVGGGLSPLGRTFGLASDHVRSFEVVTGDGVLRRASATEDPDLFRALRGGRSTTGVVTSVQLGLLPVTEIFGGAVFYGAADVETVLRAWGEWAPGLPEQASASVAVMRLPDAPFVPPPLAGTVSLAVRFAWLGDPAEGAEHFASVAAAATPVLGGMATMPAAGIGAIHNDPVDGMPMLEFGTTLRDLPGAAVDALLAEVGPDRSTPLVMTEVRLMGGALARRAAGPDAGDVVDHRDAAYTVFAVGVAAPPVREAAASAGAALLTALEPWSAGGGLPNFGGPVTDDRTEVYTPDTVRALAAVSRRYDPAGVMLAADGVRGATT